MRMTDNKYPVHRMLFLVAGALALGMLAQVAATASGGGVCDFTVQICAYGYPW